MALSSKTGCGRYTVCVWSNVPLAKDGWKDGDVANTLNAFDIGETRCNELVVQAFGICSKESKYCRRRLRRAGQGKRSRTDGRRATPASW